jgi:hypothetical protein
MEEDIRSFPGLNYIEFQVLTQQGETLIHFACVFKFPLILFHILLFHLFVLSFDLFWQPIWFLRFDLYSFCCRYDVFISIEGVREKVGSGDVQLFASCLPKVEMEVGKGKQRIRLESLHGSKDSWFTKATLERFRPHISSVYALAPDHVTV